MSALRFTHSQTSLHRFWGAEPDLARLPNGVHRASDLRLDRLSGVGGDLGGQRPDLARLIGEHVELMAEEGRLQLANLGEVLGTGETLGEDGASVELELGS